MHLAIEAASFTPKGIAIIQQPVGYVLISHSVYPAPELFFIYRRIALFYVPYQSVHRGVVRCRWPQWANYPINGGECRPKPSRMITDGPTHLLTPCLITNGLGLYRYYWAMLCCRYP